MMEKEMERIMGLREMRGRESKVLRSLEKAANPTHTRRLHH